MILTGFQSEELMLEQVRRFHYPPRAVGGHLRWDRAALRYAAIQAQFTEARTL